MDESLELTALSATVPSTSAHVSGFIPTCPEQKTRFPITTPWDKKGAGAGAPFVSTAVRELDIGRKE